MGSYSHNEVLKYSAYMNINQMIRLYDSCGMDAESRQLRAVKAAGDEAIAADNTAVKWLMLDRVFSGCEGLFLKYQIAPFVDLHRHRGFWSALWVPEPSSTFESIQGKTLLSFLRLKIATILDVGDYSNTDSYMRNPELIYMDAQKWQSKFSADTVPLVI